MADDILPQKGPAVAAERDNTFQLQASHIESPRSSASAPNAYQLLARRILGALQRKHFPETDEAMVKEILRQSLLLNKWWTPALGPLKVSQLAVRDASNSSHSLRNLSRYHVIEEREKRYAIRPAVEWIGIPDRRIPAKGLSHLEADKLDQSLLKAAAEHPDFPQLPLIYPAAAPGLTDALRAIETGQTVEEVLPTAEQRPLVSHTNAPLLRGIQRLEGNPSKVEAPAAVDGMRDFRERMARLLGPDNPEIMAIYPDAFRDGGKWTQRFRVDPATSLAVLRDLERMEKDGERFTTSAAACAEFRWKEFKRKSLSDTGQGRSKVGAQATPGKDSFRASYPQTSYQSPMGRA
jgi:hypothetical protein